MAAVENRTEPRLIHNEKCPTHKEQVEWNVVLMSCKFICLSQTQPCLTCPGKHIYKQKSHPHGHAGPRSSWMVEISKLDPVLGCGKHICRKHSDFPTWHLVSLCFFLSSCDWENWQENIKKSHMGAFPHFPNLILKDGWTGPKTPMRVISCNPGQEKIIFQAGKLYHTNHALFYEIWEVRVFSGNHLCLGLSLIVFYIIFDIWLIFK